MSTCVKVHIKKRKRSNEFQKVEDAEAVAVKVTVLWGRKTLPHRTARGHARRGCRGHAVRSAEK